MDHNDNNYDSYFRNVRVTNPSQNSANPDSANSQNPNLNPQSSYPSSFFPQNQYFFSPNQSAPQSSNYPYPVQHPGAYMNMPQFPMMHQMGGFPPGYQNFGGTSVPFTQSPTTPSSQHLGSNDPDIDEIEVENNDAARTIWSLEEDTLLISAWLNISKDPIIGTDQKGQSFWKRIEKYCRKNQPGVIKRKANAIQKHWATLNKHVSGYASCWEKTCERPVSGYSENDYIRETQKMFEDLYPKCKVDYRKRWLLLEREEKWKCQSKQSGGSKRNKSTHAGAYTSSSNTESVQNDDIHINECIRPEGVKAAKRKSKNKGITEEHAQELEALKNRHEERGQLMNRYVQAIELENERKIIEADTSVMTPLQFQAHEMQLKRLMRKMASEDA